MIARCPARLPRAEERLEHVVHELPLPPRIHHLFVLGLFLQPQHVLGEELERAVEVGLERAHRPGARPARCRTAPWKSAASAGVRDARSSAHCGRRPRAASRATGSIDSASSHEHARLVEGLAGNRRQACARDLVELHRSRHERFVVERERRDQRPPRRRRQQIEEPRVGGAAAILLRRPAERLQQRRRIEDVPPRPLRPFGLDQPDDRDVVEVAVARGLIVDQMHASGWRIRIADGERLLADPSPHRDAELVDRSNPDRRVPHARRRAPRACRRRPPAPAARARQTDRRRRSARRCAAANAASRAACSDAGCFSASGARSRADFERRVHRRRGRTGARGRPAPRADPRRRDSAPG